MLRRHTPCDDQQEGRARANGPAPRNDCGAGLREVCDLLLELRDGLLELEALSALLLDDGRSRLGDETLVGEGARDGGKVLLGLGEFLLEALRLGLEVHEAAERDEDLELAVGDGDGAGGLVLGGAERELVDVADRADEGALGLEDGRVVEDRRSL
jgi:hypothetical protein